MPQPKSDLSVFGQLPQDLRQERDNSIIHKAAWHIAVDGPHYLGQRHTRPRRAPEARNIPALPRECPNWIQLEMGHEIR